MDIFTDIRKPAVLTAAELDELATTARESIALRERETHTVNTADVTICTLLETVANLKRQVDTQSTLSRIDRRNASRRA